MSRTFYAVVYAYGRNVVNSGTRADHIYRFDTVADRVRFLDEQERAGQDADPVSATHPDVKKALRYIGQYAGMGAEWPVAV